MRINKNGKDNVSFYLPNDVIDLLDRYAGRMDLSRSQYVTRALKRQFLMDRQSKLYTLLCRLERIESN